MKKEVIYYCSFSMAPPESVELLDNNKGTIINDSGEKIVDLQEHKNFYTFGIKWMNYKFGNGRKNIIQNMKY